MSIQFKAVSKPNPRNEDDVKFYIQPIAKGMIGRARIEEDIVRQTSLSKSDARGMLAIVSDILADYLSEGYSIKLEEIGLFSLRVQSHGELKATDLSAKNIKKLSVGLRPDKMLIEKLQKATFEKVKA